LRRNHADTAAEQVGLQLRCLLAPQPFGLCRSARLVLRFQAGTQLREVSEVLE